jgi:diguanylate cyclase (GGDEF)-like protein
MAAEQGAPPEWNELTTQKLVRYEALFTLLDDIQLIEDIVAIGRSVAKQWKYVANVSSWRLTMSKEEGYLVLDGSRGQAHLTEVRTLGPWDAHFWALGRPQRIPLGDEEPRVPPPPHLAVREGSEIAVLPFVRMGRCVGLLSVAGRRELFSDLDSMFIRLLGGFLCDRVSGIVLRKQATEALIDKATRDALTGLLNRGTIIERLGSQLALAQRTGESVSVLIGDIDFFKMINDGYGHLVGDEVLREVSRRLLFHSRTSDALGRYGGEEFLFVLYPCTGQELREVAERFRRSVSEVPFAIDGALPEKLGVTISLGATSTDWHPELGMQGLLKRADDALYQSKAFGRNRVTTV